jgi:hypothetical protein
VAEGDVEVGEQGRVQRKMGENGLQGAKN